MRFWTGIGLAAILAVALASGAWAQDPNKAFTPSWPALTKNTIYTKDKPPATPALGDLPRKDSVSQYGITWTFEKPAPVGQFVNGDWYVVGPVTVKAIDPKPLYGKDIPEKELDSRESRYSEAQRVRNGFMLNPPAEQKVAYDSGTRNWFDPLLIGRLPVVMKPGDSLVATISMPKGLKINAQLKNTYQRGVGDASPTRLAAILTCVEAPLPPDAFRPSYCDRQARIYFARDLKRDLLPAFAATQSTPKIAEYVGYTQKPWVGTCFFSFEHPIENMPMYGREYSRVVGQCALLLCTDLKPEEKEPLLVNFVQVGIDLGGVIRAGHPGFEGFGGHGSGRKLPIVFAGLLLGDEQFTHVNKSFPKAAFGEDEQTAYGDCWTGAKVVFAGHRAIDERTGIARGRTGPYEHKPPATWTSGDKTSEGYRRCCTSAAWVPQALALHLMKAEKAWDHDAFFDYCDRWMYENDKEFVKTLKDATGDDHDKEWERQEQTWEPFVNEMWAQHRAAAGMPPIDGWKQKHDDSYLRNSIEKAAKQATTTEAAD
jgi:hypothetical protein